MSRLVNTGYSPVTQTPPPTAALAGTRVLVIPGGQDPENVRQLIADVVEPAAAPAALASPEKAVETPAAEFRKDGYLETLVKLIPAEAVALFLVLDSLIKSNAPESGDPEGRLVALGWAAIVVCGILNYVYLAAAKRAASLKLEDPNGPEAAFTPAQKAAAKDKLRQDFNLTCGITTVAYLIWVYTLPAWVIAEHPMYWDILGAFLLALFTTVIPAVNGLLGRTTPAQ